MGDLVRLEKMNAGKQVLVTGGAGYIGSFMVKRLLNDGYSVVVADNLSRGSKNAVERRATLKVGDLGDEKFLNQLFSEFQFDGVFHFAGYIAMGESMEKPGMYFLNNVCTAVKILDAMVSHKVLKFIFSSTAGVYGNPTASPIPEDHKKNPTNPYGESKLMVERILPWYQKIHGINYAILRYFNAAGAAVDGMRGEAHSPETHIIPKAIEAALTNTSFTLYGDDYETPDGTCIRDYIHVLDLVEAHLLVLKKMQEGSYSPYYNIGTGKGYSNKQVVEMIKKISGVDFTVNVEKRRSGDAAILVAEVDKISKELGFLPRYSDLQTIVKTAYEWHKNSLKFKVQSSK